MRYLWGEGRVVKWVGGERDWGTEGGVGVPVRVESGVTGAVEFTESDGIGWVRGLVFVGEGEM